MLRPIMNELDKPVRLNPDGSIDERDAKRLEDHIMAIIELRIMGWVDQPKKEKTMSKITVTEDVEWEFKWQGDSCYVHRDGRSRGAFRHERAINSRWPAEAQAEARRVIQANRKLKKDETRCIVEGTIIKMESVAGGFIRTGIGASILLRDRPERIDFYNRHRPLKDNEIRDPEGYPREMTIDSDGDVQTGRDGQFLGYGEGHTRRLWATARPWPSESARLEAFDRMKDFWEKHARPPKPLPLTYQECVEVLKGCRWHLFEDAVFEVSKATARRDREIREWEEKYG